MQFSHIMPAPTLLGDAPPIAPEGQLFLTPKPPKHQRLDHLVRQWQLPHEGKGFGHLLRPMSVKLLGQPDAATLQAQETPEWQKLMRNG